MTLPGVVEGVVDVGDRLGEIEAADGVAEGLGGLDELGADGHGCSR